MTITLAPDVTATETEHGTVLLDERRGRYFNLNATGALVLGALLDGHDPGQAAGLLRDRYGIEGQRADADVSALIGALHGARLVRP